MRNCFRCSSAESFEFCFIYKLCMSHRYVACQQIFVLLTFQLRKQRAQRKVWDRKRKRFVNAQDVAPSKKKIVTESGGIISSTYKKNLYAEWKKKSKFEERDGVGPVDRKGDWRGMLYVYNLSNFC